MTRLLASLLVICPALIAPMLVGCAQNAFLELQIEMPPKPAGPERWFASVQVRRAAPGNFGAEWQGGDVVSAVELTDQPFFDCISVEGFDETVDLQVRVRFCNDIDCADGMARRPERFFEIEHPFYIGARTRWRTNILRVPLCTAPADCAVGTCATGDMICTCSADAECGVGFRCSPETGPGGTTRTCIGVVDKCDVQGCLAGTAVAGFCDSEGNHECEGRSDDVDPMTYMCPSSAAP